MDLVLKFTPAKFDMNFYVLSILWRDIKYPKIRRNWLRKPLWSYMSTCFHSFCGKITIFRPAIYSTSGKTCSFLGETVSNIASMQKAGLAKTWLNNWWILNKTALKKPFLLTVCVYCMCLLDFNASLPLAEAMALWPCSPATVMVMAMAGGPRGV